MTIVDNTTKIRRGLRIFAIEFGDGYGDALRRPAMDEALRSDRPAMTGPLRLQARDSGAPILGVLLYRKALLVEESGEAEAPYGMVGVGLKLQALFDTLSHDVAPGYGLRVDDVSKGSPEQLYATEGVPDAATAGLRREWRFGGRVWALSIYPPPPSGQIAASTLAAGGGLVASALLAFLLGNLSGQQKRAEGIAGVMTAGLRRSEKRFELAVSATDEGIWEWEHDAGCHALYLSPRCAQLLGYEAGALPCSPRGILRTLDGAVRRELLAALRAHLRQGSALDCELAWRRRDGTPAWFHLVGKTEFDASALQRAQVFVEYEPQTRIEGELQQMPADFAVTEFWRVLQGQAAGRTAAQQITVFDSVGFALADYSALRCMHALARSAGLLAQIELIPTLDDPKDLFAMVRQAQAAHTALNADRKAA